MRRPSSWLDWPREDIDTINAAMRDANDAFDLAYNQSPKAADMLVRVRATREALARVEAILSSGGTS